jgi:hypothetical protein
MVERQYLFRLDILQDPRNMQKEDLIDFFNHVYDRQLKFGPEDAFRFSHYKQRGHGHQEAMYPTTENQSQPGKKKKRKNNTKKGKAKAKGKAKGKKKAAEEDPEDENEDRHVLDNAGNYICTEWVTDVNMPDMPDMQVLPGNTGDSHDQVLPTPVICPALLNLCHDGTTGVPMDTNASGIMPFHPGSSPNMPDRTETFTLNQVATTSKKRKTRVDEIHTESAEQQKRRRTRTADDLAAEEAAQYGSIGTRRRPVGNRKYAHQS